MEWIAGLSKAIGYIEDNLTKAISLDSVSRQAYSSSSHFQLIFHLVTGLTVGEYIRNRRLSLAAQDLLRPKSRVIDIAMRYQYDTPESFSKAFMRFHGVTPSKMKKGQARVFNPFTISISVQGGFEMSWKFADEFHLADWKQIGGSPGEELTPEEKYKRVVSWAGSARGKNPGVFDALTEWILDDSQWTEDKLAENGQILMQGVFARFKDQNAKLRELLKELEPIGVVNPPVFAALDRFDEELSGKPNDKRLREIVGNMFADFGIMRERNVREQIAGNKTGPTGTNSVEIFGYINYLKDCDAQVQWCLFMPDTVKRQQNGFQVDSFEYKEMPAMRFVGQAYDPFENNMDVRKEIALTLDAMSEYATDFEYDVLLTHLYGKGVDSDDYHSVWGRFMQADTPVPEGYIGLDFEPPPLEEKPGLPYIAQFAFAQFSGDPAAMHGHEGFDGTGMYDVTRNIILGQGVGIPYPDKYWTAEVFVNGYDQPGTAYLFSVVL